MVTTDVRKWHNGRVKEKGRVREEVDRRYRHPMRERIDGVEYGELQLTVATRRLKRVKRKQKGGAEYWQRYRRKGLDRYLP